MQFEPVELELARRRVEGYIHCADDAHAELIRESERAQECMDCEAFLRLGITSLEWLERCKETLAIAASEGIFDLTPELELVLENLHVAWLRPCEFAEKWIARCQASGFAVENLAEFRDCCDRASDWIEQNELYKASKAARDAKLNAEPW